MNIIKNSKHDGSFCFIPNGYVPILITKSLFKNSDHFTKKINDIHIPLYVLDDLKNDHKKPPNAFILFRNQVFKQVRTDKPNCSSREISVIIGKMWREMSTENKTPYQLKANEIKYKQQYPQKNTKKLLSNIKRRNYIKHKELKLEKHILSIKKLFLELYKIKSL